MSNYAVIRDEHFDLLPLEVIQIVASRFGYDDTDVEPMDSGVKVTARGRSGTFTVRGASEKEVAEKFCDRLLTETERMTKVG